MGKGGGDERVYVCGEDIKGVVGIRRRGLSGDGEGGMVAGWSIHLLSYPTREVAAAAGVARRHRDELFRTPPMEGGGGWGCSC